QFYITSDICGHILKLISRIIGIYIIRKITQFLNTLYLSALLHLHIFQARRIASLISVGSLSKGRILVCHLRLFKHSHLSTFGFLSLFLLRLLCISMILFSIYVYRLRKIASYRLGFESIGGFFIQFRILEYTISRNRRRLEYFFYLIR